MARVGWARAGEAGEGHGQKAQLSARSKHGSFPPLLCLGTLRSPHWAPKQAPWLEPTAGLRGASRPPEHRAHSCLRTSPLARLPGQWHMSSEGKGPPGPPGEGLLLPWGGATGNYAEPVKGQGVGKVVGGRGTTGRRYPQICCYCGLRHWGCATLASVCVCAGRGTGGPDVQESV